MHSNICYNNGRTNTYQGLRVLFIISIVIYHCGGRFLGVPTDFFFVLSGFLYKRSRCDYFDYIKRKYIGFFYVNAVGLLLYFLSSNDVGLGVVPHIFMVQSWIPNEINFHLNYNGVAWFLSSLLFCYIVSPILYRLSSYKYTFAFYIAVLFLITHLPVCEWIKGCPLQKAIEYGIGISSARLIEGKHERSISMLIDILILSSFFVLHLLIDIPKPYDVLIYSAFIVFLYLYPSRLKFFFLGNKFFIILAEYSLYIYMWHWMFVKYLLQYTDNMYALFIFGLLMSLLMGFIYKSVFNLVERMK